MHAQQVGRVGGAVVGFAFAILWIVVGFESALFCVVAGVLGFAAVAVVQRHRLSLPALDLSRLRALTKPPAPPRRQSPRPRPRVHVEPPSAENALADTGYGW